MRAGVDTGGTFTDVVLEDGSVTKVPSTPVDPARAVAQGVAGRALDHLAHGSTVATNALLERRGAPIALVTNLGFEDVLEIARQDRPSLYDPLADRPTPLVPRHLRFGVRGRLDANGREIEPVDPVALPAFPPEVVAVAVCLLHADLDPVHEQAVATELRRRDLDVTCSHEVAPEFREYERMSTTVVDAYLRPVCREYVARVGRLARDVEVMTSAGGLVPAAAAAERPARLLLSGPAAGVRAAAWVAAANRFGDAVSFDMGGTSTDVCLIAGGAPGPSASLVVGGLPVRLPAVDVHTIGAGGGSIAEIDPGGALGVGPRSAGAVPGPACYGRGGGQPTVTDADLLLGRIPLDRGFPGIGLLDGGAARRALDAAGVAPADVVAVVDAAMVEAIRVVTVARGVHPGDLALVAFGGAGPLHACALADALGMAAVVVPARAGVLSAVGLLGAPSQRDLVRSWPTPLDHTGLGAALADLAEEATALLGCPPGDVRLEVAVDCRYAGQSHELTVPGPDAFHAEHARRNGFSRPDRSVEVVALRARASLPSPVAADRLTAAPPEPVVGPAVVARADCTIWVPDGWRGEPGEAGALVLRRVR